MKDSAVERGLGDRTSMSPRSSVTTTRRSRRSSRARRPGRLPSWAIPSPDVGPSSTVLCGIWTQPGLALIRATELTKPGRGSTGPVVIEDCQHLYERRIGGFEALSAFLDELANADVTVVTGWNRYAWVYLAAVQALDRGFSSPLRSSPSRRTDRGTRARSGRRTAGVRRRRPRTGRLWSSRRATRLAGGTGRSRCRSLC